MERERERDGERERERERERISSIGHSERFSVQLHTLSNNQALDAKILGVIIVSRDMRRAAPTPPPTAQDKRRSRWRTARAQSQSLRS